MNVDWDEYHIGKTQVRPKTNEPRWNEEFTAVRFHIYSYLKINRSFFSREYIKEKPSDFRYFTVV